MHIYLLITPGSLSQIRLQKHLDLLLHLLIHVYAIHEQLTAWINGMNFGVLLLTIPTRHFPLNNEGAQEWTIEVTHQARGIYEMLLKLILALLASII